jgi:hypothetical protein
MGIHLRLHTFPEFSELENKAVIGTLQVPQIRCHICLPQFEGSVMLKTLKAKRFPELSEGLYSLPQFPGRSLEREKHRGLGRNTRITLWFI